MNVVAVTGHLSSEPTVRELPTGSTLINYELTTRVDGAGVSVPLVWFDPPKKVAVGGSNHTSGTETPAPSTRVVSS